MLYLKRGFPTMSAKSNLSFLLIGILLMFPLQTGAQDRNPRPLALSELKTVQFLNPEHEGAAQLIAHLG